MLRNRVSGLSIKSPVIPHRSVDEFFDTTTKTNTVPQAGRAWRASELRLKSFSDLHKLWFVLLKEKNVLLAQRAAFRSSKDPTKWLNRYRVRKVTLSMARLKVVLGERQRIIKEAKQEVREIYALKKKQERLEENLQNITEKQDKINKEKEKTQSNIE